MNQSSVVAVFEDRAQAERARQQLITSGVPSDRLSLHSGDESSDTSVADAPGTQSDSETGIGHFFRSLFGMDDDQPAHYEEAVRRGHATLVVDCLSEDEIDGVRTILDGYDVIDIDERAAQWASDGRMAMDAGRSDAGMAAGTLADTDTDATIPVIEEDLAVGKREVERGRVRVYTRVTEQPVEESVQLREEHARVTRQPVDRPATEADLDDAFQEGSIEIHERAEIPVVQKRARVVEEVQVGKQVEERTETVRDKLRKTDVRVEEQEAAPVAAESEKPRRSNKPRSS